MRTLAILLVMVAGLAAQVTPMGSIGTPQIVPDPVFTTGAPGAATLVAKYCASGVLNPGLEVRLCGLPLGYNTGPAVTQEQVLIALGVGSSALPGAPVLGGMLYLAPAGPMAVVTAGASQWHGPPDTVPCPGLIVFPGPTPPTPNGRGITIPIPPAAVGLFSVQGALFDPALSRIFTTNAINFSLP